MEWMVVTGMDGPGPLLAGLDAALVELEFSDGKFGSDCELYSSHRTFIFFLKLGSSDQKL